MKVILQKEIASLGDAGEIKRVADGYARNYLMPRKLVIPAHVGSTRALEHQKRMLARKELKRKSSMENFAAQLKEIPNLELSMPAGENRKLFGSVTNRHISEVLASQGFHVDRKKIEINSKIRSLGSYTVPIHLMKGISIPIKVDVVPDEKFLQKEREKQEELEKEKVRQETIEAIKQSNETEEDPLKDSSEESTEELASSIEESETTSTEEIAPSPTEESSALDSSPPSPSENSEEPSLSENSEEPSSKVSEEKDP